MREVRLIDGAALEDWLDQNPAVAARFARFELALMPPVGARSAEEFWDEYGSRFKPALTEQVLLCDREQQAKELLRQLGSGERDMPWRADSPDEVVAFAIAAVRNADPDSCDRCVGTLRRLWRVVRGRLHGRPEWRLLRRHV